MKAILKFLLNSVHRLGLKQSERILSTELNVIPQIGWKYSFLGHYGKIIDIEVSENEKLYITIREFE